jgi:hypothetical protein
MSGHLSTLTGTSSTSWFLEKIGRKNSAAFWPFAPLRVTAWRRRQQRRIFSSCSIECFLFFFYTSSSCSGDGHSCWLWLGVMTPCTAQPGTKPSNAQIIILHTFCKVLKPFQRTLLIIFKSSWYLVVYTFLRLLLLRDLTLLLLLLPTDDSGQIEQGTFFPFLHSGFGSWKKKEKSVKKELDQNRAIEISNGNERTRQTLLLSRSLCHNTLKQKRHLLAANQGWQMTAWIYTFSQTFFSGDLMALLTLISTWTQLQKSRTFLSTLLQTAISYQELKTPITHKKSIWVRRQLCTSSSSMHLHFPKPAATLW